MEDILDKHEDLLHVSNEYEVSLLQYQGNVEMIKGNRNDAINLYTHAINLDPYNHLLYSNRSAAYAKIKRYSEALADCEKTISIKPECIKGYSCKGAVLTRLRQWEEAFEVYKDGLKLDPNNQQMKTELEKCRNKIVSYQILEIMSQIDANEIGEQHCNTKGNRQVQSLKDKGNSMLSKGNVEEAIELFTQAIDLDPYNHLLYFKRSAAYAKMEKYYMHALIDSCKTISIKPDWVKGYICKGDALYYLERWHDALATYEDGLMLNPRNTHLKKGVAQCRAKILWNAAAIGDIEDIELMIFDGADLNYQSPTGFTPLHTAASNGYEDIVQMLLNAKADVEITSIQGGTALHSATFMHRPSIVKLLLAAGANRNCRTKEGDTPIYYASQLNILDVLCLLIQAGSDVNIHSKHGDSPLDTACSNGHTEVVQKLLGAGANVEVTDSQGSRPLHTACSFGHYAAASLLIDARCQLQPINNSMGDTPMHKAASGGRLQLGQLLLRKGHPLIIFNNHDLTPLDYAQMGGHHKFYNWALKQREYDGYNHKHTSGQVRCREQYEHYVESVMNMIISDPRERLHNIRSGLRDVHMQDLQRKTALHLAADAGDIETVKALFEFGAHPLSVTLNGMTPGNVALAKGHHHIYNFLKQQIQRPEQMNWTESCAMYYDLLKAISSAGNNEDLSDLEAQDDMFAAVKNISRLLCLGTPLTPPGSINTELISMCINNHYNNSPRVLEILLSAGAPLYGTDGSHSILQMVWMAKSSTTREAVMVTRQFEMHLRYERQQILEHDNTDRLLIILTDSLLKQLGADISLKEELERILPGHHIVLPEGEAANSGYCSLVYLKSLLKSNQDKRYYQDKIKLDKLYDKYSNIKPWRASLRMKIEELECQNYDSKHSILVRACQLGLSSLSWWIWRTGVNTSMPDDKGNMPILSAISNHHWDTVQHLVRYMSANPFIKSPTGVDSFHLLPEFLKQDILKVLAMREFNKLDKRLISIRSKAERNETKSIALLIASFYSICKLSGNGSWKLKAIFSHLLGLMNGRIVVENMMKQDDADENKNIGKDEIVNMKEEKEEKEDNDDSYSWIWKICQKLKSKFENPPAFGTNDEGVSLPQLILSMADLANSISILSEDTYIISQNKKNIEFPIAPLKHIFKKAIKVATEGRFYFLLYMLTTADYQSIDDPLNELIQSPPLHHAASAGNLANIVFLLHNCKANPEVKDINGNTAAHIAYMNGHKNLAFYLLTNTPSICNVKNSSGMSPGMIKKAQIVYEKLYEIKVKDEESKEYFELSEQTDPESLSWKLLETWLHRNKRMSFKSIVAKNVVDFSKGEAKTLIDLATKFAENTGDGIARCNPIFKGRLILVGSAGDNARLYAPDEYDCTWILDCDNVISKFVDLPKEQQVYRQYKHQIHVDSDNSEIRRLLKKTNLLEEFYTCAQESIKEIIPTLHPNLTLILPGVKRIGCGICLSLAWYGIEYPLLLINIDLVPVIKTPRPNNFPFPPLAEKLNITPHLREAYIVQTYIEEGAYRVSTTMLEQQVLSEAEIGCQKLIFVLAKLFVSILKTEKWAPQIFQDRFKYFDSHRFKIPKPSGFLLKSAYFHELESLPNPNDWKENCIVDRLKGIFYTMCRVTGNDNKLDSGIIRNYFSPTTQPGEAGFMAPAIFGFIEKNENELIKKQESS